MFWIYSAFAGTDTQSHSFQSSCDRRWTRTTNAGERIRGTWVKDVKFWGRLSPEAVREALQQIDVLLLLSDSEGLPLALLEAMGHGVAPIVTNLEGGLTEVVQDGHNGFLVEVGDVKAFADRIQTLSRDREMLTSMGRAAWEASPTLLGRANGAETTSRRFRRSRKSKEKVLSVIWRGIIR